MELRWSVMETLRWRFVHCGMANDVRLTPLQHFVKTSYSDSFDEYLQKSPVSVSQHSRRFLGSVFLLLRAALMICRNLGAKLLHRARRIHALSYRLPVVWRCRSLVSAGMPLSIILIRQRCYRWAPYGACVTAQQVRTIVDQKRKKPRTHSFSPTSILFFIHIWHFLVGMLAGFTAPVWPILFLFLTRIVIS